jgi:hypothetical protein
MKRAVALALLLLAGCPPRGVKFGPEGYITDPQKLLALLDAHDRRFVTLRGDVKLKITSPEQSGSVSQYLAVMRPTLLHVETFNFFGKPVSSLVSDSNAFSLYDAEHGTFYRGPATTQVVARFLPLALPPEAAVAMLLGQVPRISPEKTSLQLDEKRGVYLLVLERGQVKQTLEIGTEDQRVQRSHVEGEGGFDLALSDYKDEKAGPFPHKLTLTAPAQGVELTYKYSDVEVNGPPDLSLFHQEPPPSVKVIELDEQGREQAKP